MANSYPLMQQATAAGRELLGCEHAILAGAMTWVSERHLVSSISNAGGYGVLACGSMTPDLLSGEIVATLALTSAPFGVNLIVMHPELEALVDVCLDHKVPAIVFAGGLPSKTIIERAQAGGAKVISFAPALAIGKKLIRSGVDGLVIEGHEAGGHIGPVSTAVLAQEILPVLKDIPVFAAGGIGNGEGIAAFLSMGAVGAQLGTRFVCAKECQAHPAFKKAFLRASARDATVSVQIDPDFPVIPVRAIKNAATEAFTRKQIDVIAEHRAGKLDALEASLAIEHFWAGALRRAAVDGDVENGSLMAGQSVGMVKSEQSISDIIDELCAGTEEALSRGQHIAA